MAHKSSGVHARGDHVPFAHFVRFHPSNSRAQSGRSSTGKSRFVDDEVLRQLQLQFPWMSIEELKDLLVTTRGQVERSGNNGGKSSGKSSQRNQAPEEINEDVVAAVAAQAEELRSQIVVDDQPTVYFKVRFCCCRWSAAKFGVPATDIGAYAKDRSTDLWCTAVGWPRAKSYAIPRYGHDNCHHLASECVRRGNYFMQTWVGQGSPTPFDFTAVVTGYVEPPDYAQWFDGLPIDSFSFQAAMQLRDLMPRPVPA